MEAISLHPHGNGIAALDGREVKTATDLLTDFNVNLFILRNCGVTE